MKKQILLSLATLLTAHSILAMRAPLRPSARPACPLAHLSSPPQALARCLVRRYSEDKSHERARQEAWIRMEHTVADRICELRDLAKKHRAQSAQHTNYAHAYETLAELERDKHELFILTISKLNASFDYLEVPNLESETKLMKIVTDLQQELHDALPKNDKI